MTGDWFWVMLATIFVELFFCLLWYIDGFVAGRKKQREIEDTAALYPYEYEGKKYFIRLYDTREASVDGKGWEE